VETSSTVRHSNIPIPTVHIPPSSKLPSADTQIEPDDDNFGFFRYGLACTFGLYLVTEGAISLNSHFVTYSKYLVPISPWRKLFNFRFESAVRDE
jgi:hypothetical protein